jgi:hypothetical protein
VLEAVPRETWVQRGRVLVGMAGGAATAAWGWNLWVNAGQLSWGWLGLWLVGAFGVASGLSGLAHSNRWMAFWLYLMLCVLLPLYGAAGALVIALYPRFFRGKGVADTYGEKVGVVGQRDTEEVHLNAGGSFDELVRQQLSVQSYMDIMRGPDALLKKALISRILAEWTPNAVGLLRQALSDAEYEIRTYASTALTSIESRMSSQIAQLRQSLEGRPADTDVRLRLVQAYLSYAASQLLDANSMRHYVETAIEILDATELPPGDDEIRLRTLVMRAQAANLAGDNAREEDAWNAVLALQPGYADAIGPLCDLLLRQRRLGELQQLCAQLRRKGGDNRLTAAAATWAEASGEVAGA